MAVLDVIQQDRTSHRRFEETENTEQRGLPSTARPRDLVQLATLNLQ
jgi:hypothetical protein